MLRSFHNSAAVRAAKPALKALSGRNGRSGFDKSFKSTPKKSEEKIWDRLNITKDEFFIRKYGNISPEERKKLDDKVARQRLLREARKRHELGEDYDKPKKSNKIALNPLSEYLYGTHPVISALSAGKREAFSKLYIHNPKEHTAKILQLAKKYGIKVVEKSTKGEMNTLSANGVHNGVVLETRPLLLPLVESFGEHFDQESGQYTVTMVDERTNEAYETMHTVARQVPHTHNKLPLGIFLDGITDPQNIGNIIRSAYYLGADFMVVPEYDSARLGPVAAKASAGALDMLPIYRLDEPMSLVDNVRNNGWNVVSTSSRLGEDELNATKSKHREQLQQKYIDFGDLPALMNQAPMLMIFGSEGAGVRTNLKFKSDYLVGLNKSRADPEGLVDSLNVGTAAALLMSKCFE